MLWSRRQILLRTVSITTIAAAGCASDSGEVSTPTIEPASNDGADDGESGADDDDTPTPTPENSVVPLGEPLVFANNDGAEVTLTATDAELRDAMLDVMSNRLSSTTPQQQDRSFLIISVTAENTGSEPVTLPGEVILLLNGQQYSQSNIVLSDDRFPTYNEVRPGATVSGVIVFAVPPVDATAEFSMQFPAADDPPTATWRLNLSNLDRQRYDFSDQSVGDSITFGTEQTQYELAVTEIERTDGYRYTIGDFEYEQTPSSGNEVVLASVVAENTGESPVGIPSIFDMSMIAGSQQSDPKNHQKESEAYEGGQIAPGVQRSGIVDFEIPAGTSEVTMQISLTSDITASWTG